MVPAPHIEATPGLLGLDTSVFAALILFKRTLKNNLSESSFALDFPQVSVFLFHNLPPETYHTWLYIQFSYILALATQLDYQWNINFCLGAFELQQLKKPKSCLQNKEEPARMWKRTTLRCPAAHNKNKWHYRILKGHGNFYFKRMSSCKLNERLVSRI